MKFILFSCHNLVYICIVYISEKHLSYNTHENTINVPEIPERCVPATILAMCCEVLCGQHLKPY